MSKTTTRPTKTAETLVNGITRSMFGHPIPVYTAAAQSWSFQFAHDGISYYRRGNGEAVAVRHAL